MFLSSPVVICFENLEGTFSTIGFLVLLILGTFSKGDCDFCDFSIEALCSAAKVDDEGKVVVAVIIDNAESVWLANDEGDVADFAVLVLVFGSRAVADVCGLVSVSLFSLAIGDKTLGGGFGVVSG